MKKSTNIGVLILIIIFLIFYIVTTVLLDKRNISKNNVIPEETEVVEENTYESEKEIVNSLYQGVRSLYDAINNKYTVDQEDSITISDIIYKKITNFDELTNSLFTNHGLEKYVNDMGNYFAKTDDKYYLASNLASYQTYYFRGDDTKIFITDADDNEINGIIYEKNAAGNRSTLATIKVVNSNDKWLIDEINILVTE